MKFILFDANAIGYACQYGTVLRSGDMMTQAVFGFINIVLQYHDRYPDFVPIVLWDGRAQWRFDLCPTYKSNRSPSDPRMEELRASYKEQVPYIKKVLSSIGVRQLHVLDMEADDLAGHLLKQAPKDSNVILVTSDKDWLQLVRNGVFWHDFRSGRSIGTYNFERETGYLTAEAFLDAKCLMGDKSDAIPGVGGIGEKGALKFLQKYGSVKNFFDLVDAGMEKPGTKPLKNLAAPEGRSTYERNRKVMQLLDVKTPDTTKAVKFDITKNRDAFIELCGELAMTSLMPRVNEIMSKF